MKISEMTNDQATQAMIKLAQPIANIMDDPNAESFFKELADQKDKKLLNTIGTVLPKAVAFCMKDHKKDLYEIISALTLIPSSKVGSMNFMETVKELKGSIDEDFIGFFKSSGETTVIPGNES